MYTKKKIFKVGQKEPLVFFKKAVWSLFWRFDFFLKSADQKLRITHGWIVFKATFLKTRK